MKQYVISLIVAISCIGCATIPQNEWRAKPSLSGHSPWARVIPHLALSAANITNAVAEVEHLANGAGEKSLSIHFATPPNPADYFSDIASFMKAVDDFTKPRPITVELRDVQAYEALLYVAEIANYQPFFQGNTAVLAPRVRNYGLLDVELCGRCRSRDAGTRIEQFALICTLAPEECCGPESRTSIHTVTPSKDGAFSLRVQVPGYASVASHDGAYAAFYHPSPQTISCIAIEDHHYPLRFSVNLVETNLHYRVAVDLMK